MGLVNQQIGPSVPAIEKGKAVETLHEAETEIVYIYPVFILQTKLYIYILCRTMQSKSEKKKIYVNYVSSKFYIFIYI